MRIRLLITVAIYIFSVKGKAQSSNEKLAVYEYDDHLLTHLLTPAGPVPTAP